MFLEKNNQSSKPAPPSAGLFNGVAMSTYMNKAELEMMPLNRGDRVVVGGFLYRLRDVYWEFEEVDDDMGYEGPCGNGAIFVHLGLDKVEFCREAYGYETFDFHEVGIWPQFKPLDLKGAKQVMLALYDVVEPAEPLEVVAAWVEKVRS